MWYINSSTRIYYVSVRSTFLTHRCLLYIRSLSAAEVGISETETLWGGMHHYWGKPFSTLRPGQNGHYFTEGILQTTVSNIFFYRNSKFLVKFHWPRLVHRVPLTINQHWCRKWLVMEQANAWTNDDPVHWCIDVWPSLSYKIKIMS